MMNDMNKIREACEREAAERLENEGCSQNNCSVCEDNRALAKILAETPTLFQAQLATMGACQDARLWAGTKTAREAWETCDDFYWMAWLSDALGGRYVSTAEAMTCDQYRAVCPFSELQRLSRGVK